MPSQQFHPVIHKKRNIFKNQCRLAEGKVGFVIVLSVGRVGCIWSSFYEDTFQLMNVFKRCERH